MTEIIATDNPARRALLDAVWESPDRGTELRLLLVFLAHHADETGRTVTSMEALASAAGCGALRVRRLLARLEMDGVVTVHPADSAARPHEYRIWINARPLAVNDPEARWQAVPCPTCKAAAGEPCTYRGKVRGPGEGRRTHLARQDRAVARERRELANQDRTSA